MHHLNQHSRAVHGPPIPLDDLAAYADQLVTNTQRNLSHLNNLITQEKDTLMRIATWNEQGAQGTLSL